MDYEPVPVHFGFWIAVQAILLVPSMPLTHQLKVWLRPTFLSDRTQRGRYGLAVILGGISVLALLGMFPWYSPSEVMFWLSEITDGAPVSMVILLGIICYHTAVLVFAAFAVWYIYRHPTRFARCEDGIFVEMTEVRGVRH